MRNLIALLDVVAERMEPFYLAQRISEEKYKTMNKEEIKEHDRNILSTDMQLYALDYFLLIHKMLFKDDKKEVILKSSKELPSLLDDAINEDMLKKIIYSFIDNELMMRMIANYYEYKDAFRNVSEDNEITKEIKIKIKNALKKYILSLIEASEDLDIIENNNGLYLPYGKMGFHKLKEIINNS